MRSAAAILLVMTLALGLPAQEAQQGTPPSNQQQPTVYDDPQDVTPPATPEPQDQTQQAPVITDRTDTPATGGRSVAAGTEIKATLDTPLSTKTSKEGDRFTATVIEPVRAADGATAIPAGARINGEVTNVEEGKALPTVRGRGQLNLRFREVVLSDGTRLPLTATLVSVRNTKGARAGSVDEEGEVKARTSGTQVAKDIGIGAAIGTVAGLIFGAPLKGLAIGAAAGGGYVLATRGKDVNLLANSGILLRVDQAITVPPSATQPQR